MSQVTSLQNYSLAPYFRNKSSSPDSLCARLSQILADKPLFLHDSSFFNRGKWVKEIECRDLDLLPSSNEGKRAKEVAFATFKAKDSGGETITEDAMFDSVAAEKDLIHLKNPSRATTSLLVSNAICVEFWKFLNKAEGYDRDLITSGGSWIHFAYGLSLPTCRDIDGKTRIHFKKEHQEICFKEEGRFFKTCSTHIDFEGGQRGCTVDGVDSKSNCFMARDSNGSISRFYSSKFKEDFVTPPKEGKAMSKVRIYP